MARHFRRGYVVKNYDFHDIFRISIRSNVPNVIRHFEAEYGVFEAAQSHPVDLDATVGKFSVVPDQSLPTGNESTTGGGIYVRAGHKVSRWRAAIRGLAQPTTELWFDGGVFSLDFLQGYYIEQIMRFKIASKGLALVHGGCVARNGYSVLFPGLGHAGKTALALQKTMGGWHFQADDKTFISSAGQTFSYPRRLHISGHMYDCCPAAMRQLSLRPSLLIKLKKALYYCTLKYADLSEPLRLVELISNGETASVARLRVVLLLKSCDATSVKGPFQLEEESMIEQLMFINGLEAKHFDDLLLQVENAEYRQLLLEQRAKERATLEQAVSGIPGYEVLIPHSAPNRKAVLERTARIVDDLLGVPNQNELVPG